MPRWLRIPGRRAAERLLLFARYPGAGSTKTRLIPALGAEGAAALHTKMVRHTLAWADDLARLTDVEIEIHFAGGDEAGMREIFGQQRCYRAQIGGDLGTRMSHAFEKAFRAGTERLVIVGTDCPDLSAERAAEAFRALRAHEVVIGPAVDGGYYLIGLRRPQPTLFAGIDWGTERVLTQTVAAARAGQLSVAQLAPLADVDEPADLPIWERANAARSELNRDAKISIIIPALQEEANIGATLEAVRAGLSPDGDVEIILVDGGSTDATAEIAARCGARVITSERGRARQMNAGAAVARGEILLFLHADTRLPPDFDREIRKVLADPAVVVGAFRLCIDGQGFGLRLVERLANLRARRRGLPYGDQAIFLREWIFRTLGGYPDYEIMEDYALIDSLRRRGRVAIAGSAVRTSARRWQRHGVLRTSLVHQVLVVGYRLGVSPRRLAAWYRCGVK